MKLRNMSQKYLGVVALALMLIFSVSACNNDEPEVVEAPVAVDGEADVAADADADADVAVDAEADVTVEAEEETVVAADSEIDTDDVDAVSTSVMTDTIIDTDVITEVEVITQVEAAEIQVDTTVMTDTDVTVDRASDTESDVTVETEDVDTSATTAIIVMTDSAGGTFLGDPVEQRPFFVSEQGEMVVHEDFEPIEVNDDIIYDEGLDQNMFGEIDQDGRIILTYNDTPLYRYVGPDGGDWRTAANDLGLRQITPEGEMGDMSE